MPIYVYETMPGVSGKKPKYYDIQRSMTDEPLTAHPCAASYWEGSAC